MFSTIKKLSGYITVRDAGASIIVEGVPGYFITNDISKIWKTSRIEGMFDKVTRSSFTINKFFLLDLSYILEQFSRNRKVGAGSARTARKILEALYEETWLGKTRQDIKRGLDFSRLKLFYKTPLEPQDSFFKNYDRITAQYQLNGYLLNGAPGSGKTYMGMVLAEMLHSDHVIVVCPINAVYRVWQQSIESEYRDSPTYWIAAENKPFAGEKYIIGHYETLAKLIETTANLKGKVTIILDECHNLNEMSSLRTNLFIKLCKQTKSENILWASGTPIKALGSESIPLLLTIDPMFNEHVALIYKKIYGKDATKAIDILSNRIQLVSHVIEKSELNLQPPIIETFKVTVPNGMDFTLDAIKKDMSDFILQQMKYYSQIAQESLDFFNKCISHCNELFKLNPQKYKQELIDLETYRRFVKDIRNTTAYYVVKYEMKFCSDLEKSLIIPLLPSEWRERFKDVKSIVKYVQLKIQGECLGRVLGKKRMECVKAVADGIDYVKYIESTQKKTLIFTSYVEVLEFCTKKLTELELKPLAVYGKTNKDLNEIVEKFAKDESLNPLVATYPSLSTAVPLTMADVMIMVNPPFRDYIHQQAISRIHRLGSNTQVYVYIAALDTGDKPNLSSRTIDILKWSQEQVAAITGVKSPFEVDDKAIAMEGIDDNFIDDFMYREVSLEEHFIEPVFESQQIKKPGFNNW